MHSFHTILSDISILNLDLSSAKRNEISRGANHFLSVKLETGLHLKRVDPSRNLIDLGLS